MNHCRECGNPLPNPVYLCDECEDRFIRFMERRREEEREHEREVWT